MRKPKIETSVIISLLGIAVPLLAIVANQWLKDSRNRKAEFVKASAEFRAAFVKEVTELGHKRMFSDIMIYAMLTQSYTRHLEAVRVFRPRLNFIRKRCFDRAWNKYHGGNEKHPNFEPYAIGENRHIIFTERVNALLKFAKYT